MLDLFEAAMQRPVTLICLEDNTQTISAVRNGYSPALRHLNRTERISLGVLHEQFIEGGGGYVLKHQPTNEHKGDMFTKRLDPAGFESAILRVGLRPMKNVDPEGRGLEAPTEGHAP